ncbi:MAG: AbrB/MazE/SpoVT family DNA-binding domain-containing protein [SAR86 cluster bacterium]|uniref:AbrB/MazE/SpoVT family DNA-binding domain-containing protein n=1 Tax=SAR86 cluster bacterium TaxID=2030880 RepID=A0A2A5AUP3_9GAMM|nr:MAG: AbrB/MazE/SpoVT family DNA-binding domain-containing protein [SAR86 cluster bacterium]
MPIDTVIRKSGASAILTIPKPVLEYLDASIGTKISIDMVDGLMVCKKKADDSMTLESLLEDSPREKMVLNDEDKEWLYMGSVGSEL